MHFPKLTPLQSRFAISLAASFILVVFYLSLSSPTLAYAIETNSIAPKDPSRPRSLDSQEHLEFTEQYVWDDDDVEQNYEPDFAGLDRGIIGRAPIESQDLKNNAPGKSNIQVGGDPQYWVFPNDTLRGPRTLVISRLPSPLVNGTDWLISQTSKKQQNDPGVPQVVYISLSVCHQPSPNPPNSNGAPPQLELYISLSPSNQNPGPEHNDYAVPVDGGFGNWTLINATGAIYFAVYAPASSNFVGLYSYELAVSIDAPYASYVNTTFLTFLDSDTNAALLETNVTTFDTVNYSNWMSATPPFSIFALNQSNLAPWGIHRSFCGLKKYTQNAGNTGDQQASNVNMSMTDRAGGFPKQQFYIQNLTGSSAYYAIPAIDGYPGQSGVNGVGGGGMVWAPTNFRTKSDGNCRVIFDLHFCSDVAYAVPSNPAKNFTDLVYFYDKNASNLYVNFTKSLQQIPCNTTSDAQYSLARNCTSCDKAYHKWLCAVVIPRCEDFSSPSNLTWLQPRNIARPFFNGTKPSIDKDPIFNKSNLGISYLKSSRNPWIDSYVQPGPYKEVLPCAEMCYDLVRSCPASLQFACPLQGRGLSYSYGCPSANQKKDQTNITCNYLGNATVLNVGVAQGRNLVLLTIACIAALFVGVLV